VSGGEELANCGKQLEVLVSSEVTIFYFEVIVGQSLD
jgi:hypothetical protein